MSKADLTIALDAMGGDHGPEVVIPGAAKALQERPQARFLFFGERKRIEKVIGRYKTLERQSEIHHTDRVVANDEKPSTALRKGKDTSMRLAIDAVARGDAQGVVSAGNTGALMAMAKMSMKGLPEIHRPAIASVFPTMRGQTVVLDLGANIQADSENLAQYAVLGCVYARLLFQVSTPRVGILNIGSEEVKGHDRLRGAASILSHVDFPGLYQGFVEGDDIPKGSVDVVVTDGFTGNIALKMAEGVAEFMGHSLRNAFESGFFARIGYLFASRALKKMRKSLDPRFYNGGIFMGLNGICIKSHGGGDAYAFSRATIRAIDLVQNDFNARAVQEIEKMINQESFFSQDSEGHGS